MYAALSGLLLDNPLLFWGVVIMFIMQAYIMACKVIKITFEVLNIILDFKDRLEARRKRKSS